MCTRKEEAIYVWLGLSLHFLLLQPTIRYQNPPKYDIILRKEKEIINQIQLHVKKDCPNAYQYAMLCTSSATSRRAAVAKSSSGSTPPLGTTHLSGTFELETSNTCKQPC